MKPTPIHTADSDQSSPIRPKSGFRTIGGLALLVAGLICAIPGVPGPGSLMILTALFVLSDRFAWARRARQWIERKLQSAGLAGRRCLGRPELQEANGPVPGVASGRSRVEADGCVKTRR